jgi:hypothetical protein
MDGNKNISAEIKSGAWTQLAVVAESRDQNLETMWYSLTATLAIISYKSYFMPS